MQALLGILSVGIVTGLAWAFVIVYHGGSVNWHRAMAAWHLETADKIEADQKSKSEQVLQRLMKVKLT